MTDKIYDLTHHIFSSFLSSKIVIWMHYLQEVVEILCCRVTQSRDSKGRGRNREKKKKETKAGFWVQKWESFLATNWVTSFLSLRLMRAISGPCIFLSAYQTLCTLLAQYRSAAIKCTGKCRLLLLQHVSTQNPEKPRLWSMKQKHRKLAGLRTPFYSWS